MSIPDYEALAAWIELSAVRRRIGDTVPVAAALRRAKRIEDAARPFVEMVVDDPQDADTQRAFLHSDSWPTVGQFRALREALDSEPA